MTQIDSHGVQYLLGQLVKGIEALQTEYGDMKHRLFGNGQEGVIQEHARELALLKQAFIERKVKNQLLLWALRVLGGMLVWSWGVLVGAANWLPKLHQFLRYLGW